MLPGLRQRLEYHGRRRCLRPPPAGIRIGEAENAEISLVNPAENRQADVTLTLVDNQGQARAPQTLRIPPNGRFRPSEQSVCARP